MIAIEISVVIPIYNNESHLVVLNKRLKESLSLINQKYEVIYVCDGSPDNSWDKIKEFAEFDSRVKGINLSKNYGQQQAIMSGLLFAKGLWVVVMDGDLQDLPEDIPVLYKRAIAGDRDIVVRRRKKRKDSLITKFTSAAYYKIYNLLIDDISYDGATGNFGIYSNNVVKAINQFKEEDPSFGYFAKIVGFSAEYIDIDQASRYDGTSSYTFKKRLRLALNYLISHSTKLIKFIIIVGMMISVASFIVALFLIYRYFKFGSGIEGWTSIAVFLLFQTGLIVFFLGIIGLYISKIFIQTKNRPSHIVRNSINLNYKS